jgi:hypothetical protein
MIASAIVVSGARGSGERDRGRQPPLVGCDPAVRRPVKDRRCAEVASDLILRDEVEVAVASSTGDTATLVAGFAEPNEVPWLTTATPCDPALWARRAPPWPRFPVIFRRCPTGTGNPQGGVSRGCANAASGNPGYCQQREASHSLCHSDRGQRDLCRGRNGPCDDCVLIMTCCSALVGAAHFPKSSI